MRVALQQVGADFRGIAFASRGDVFQSILQDRRRPLVEELQATRETAAVLLDLEQQGLDVLLVLVVVGVDRSVAHQVGGGGDVAAGRDFVAEAEAYCVEVS